MELSRKSYRMHQTFRALILTAMLFSVQRLSGQEVSPPADELINIESLAEQAMKSLVVVRSTDRTGGELGLGTGFAIDGNGLIATAYHVIGDGRDITIEFPDGRRAPVVEVHASSSQLDLAVVRVEKSELAPLPLSLDSRTPAGRQIVALGHPEGFRNSIVTGIVSGHQEIDSVEMLQLAMSIERGNSGGPVLDRKGEVVGIVTRKSALREKLGFALPVRLLRDLLSDPNPVPMARWSTIGALDERQWTTVFGGNWKQRAGRIRVSGTGNSFGGRTLCVNQSELPQVPYDISVVVRLGNEEGAAGLIFHSDGGDRHYGFYPSAGNLRLTRFDGPDVGSWTILHNEPSSAYRTDDWNTLTVRIERDHFECFVNGTPVVRSPDSVLPAGRAGLASFRGTDAEFRRFEIGANLVPSSPGEEQSTVLRETINSMPWNRPLQGEPVERLLPLGASASGFLEEEARRLESKAQQLKTLGRDLHEASVRRELVDLLSETSPDQLEATASDTTESAAVENSGRLLKAALLVARLDNPDVDVRAYEYRVSRMAEELQSTMPNHADDSTRLAALDRYFFDQLGVRGSRYEYDSPSNSYLNEVIDDREGIPISLSVLYIELAARVGLKVVGVGLPGHFVVRYEPHDGKEPQTIDVFNRGQRLSEAEIVGILEDARFPNEPRFREARTDRQIVERMLQNLLNLAELRREDQDVLSCLETLVAIQPDEVEYRAKRLEMRARTGRLELAIADAQWFVKNQPDGVDVERVRQLLSGLEDQLEKQSSVR